MKKAAAILLTGCLTFQMVMGAVVPTGAAELFHDGNVLTESSPNADEEIFLQKEPPESDTQKTRGIQLPEHQTMNTAEISGSNFSENIQKSETNKDFPNNAGQVNSDGGTPLQPENGSSEGTENELPENEQSNLPQNEESVLPQNNNDSLPLNEEGTLPQDNDGSLPLNEEGTLPQDNDGGLPLNEEGTLPQDNDGGLPLNEEGTLSQDNNGSLPLNEEGTLPQNNDGSLPLNEEDALPQNDEVFGTGEKELLLKQKSIDTTFSDTVGALQRGPGAIDVRLISALPFHKYTDVSVLVKSGSSTVRSHTLSMQTKDADVEGVTFSDLAAGTYTVELSADGFAIYRQDVEVADGFSSKIQVYSAQTWPDTQDVHPGILFIGDVDRDGDIDTADKDRMVAAIHSESPDKAYDLNGDGMVSISDLQYLACNLNRAPVHSAVEKAVSPGSILAVPAEGTTVAGGTVSDLLLENRSVSLSPSSGQYITPDTPVSLEFTLAEEQAAAPAVSALVIQAPVSLKDDTVANAITSGLVTVTYFDEAEQDEREMQIPIAFDSILEDNSVPVAFSAGFASPMPTASVRVGSDGSMVIDLGGQIAVKKVSIRITGTTRKEDTLVNITKVEFLNGMENHIPEPDLNIPTGVSAQPSDKEFTVSWSAQPNVTGYEVRVSGAVKGSREETQVFRSTGTTMDIKSINSKKLINKTNYTVSVRSINGDWKSPWSEAITVVPIVSKRPESPDYVQAEGGYRYVKVSWKAMDDTDSYTVYYKEKSASSFQTAGQTETTSLTIEGLKDNTAYEVYVTGTNELGSSSESAHAEAVTKTEVPKLPAYKLLNTSNGHGKLTSHIEKITINHGSMFESTLDASGTGFGLADDSYDSYWEYKNWDAGGFNNTNPAIKVTFDDVYDMNYITFSSAPMKSSFMYVRVRYIDENGQTQYVNASLSELKDQNNNTYYRIKLEKYIHAKEIHLGLGVSYYINPWLMQIGEMRFYHYDSLEDDILNLYADDSRITLKENVTAEKLLDLENRLNTKDPVSQELHPEYSALKAELERAKEIFDENLDNAISIDPSITSAKDSSIGFTGLNAWQPLGRTAAAGETLVIYVGNNGQKAGTDTSLKLIATQYHSEANSLLNTYNLKIGRNEITLGRLSSMADTEKGGQLYIAYNGNNANDRYVVRIRGGAAIPVLNLSGAHTEDRSAAVHTYVEELGAYVSRLEEMHGQYCRHTQNSEVTYDVKNCILNATDILLDQMMYSVPATQIWNSLKGSTISEKAQNLDIALAAMDNTMTLFYQHKGLSKEAGGTNSLPSRHLNIRYMRMFKGAFMYAAGNHIGIEWTEVPILAAASEISDFGWGIAHEIGHNINQGSYAVAEVTNNYFSQLLTGQIRYSMDNVYKKVTSGASGSSDNVFTSLAMYWQLHLAYDNSINDHQVYHSYADQFSNLFFARVDTYSRNPGAAPYGLKLGSDAQQTIMRLSCAAAGKNLLPFFERWGMVPDGTTKAYAANFAAEERAIYYADNMVREYRVQNQASEASLTIKNQNVVTASSAVSENAANQVLITMKANSHQGSILGYEIIRVMTSNGTAEERVIGFAPYAGTETLYTDTVTTINNRVMGYKVRAVDKFLYYSNTADAGSQKIATKGNHDKSQWTVTATNLTSADDYVITPDQNDPDNGSNPSSQTEKRYQSIRRIMDNDLSTVYTGTSGGNGQILVDMHQPLPSSSIIYYGSGISQVDIYGSTEGNEWITLKRGVSLQDQSTVWFDPQDSNGIGRWIGTYNIRYLKLFLPSGSISINELEICGPSGDNLEFLTAGDTPAIGILEKDYPAGNDSQGNPQVIPKDSLIVTGKYKGNPAYNVILVYDGNGNVLGAQETETGTFVTAEQIIFAPDPDNGNLGEVSEGTWVYYLEPGNWSTDKLPKEIRAELFRVDNALFNKNERVVSDTQIIAVPETLPSITLTGGKQK